MNKRQMVEDWLHGMCLVCEALDSLEHDSHWGEYDAEIHDLLRDADGLISYVVYEPGSDAWENFEPEGYLWSTPTDAQVEKLYPKALEWFAEDRSA